MIEGRIDERGVPVIEIPFHGRNWIATIDTGFNGLLELPEELRDAVGARLMGRSQSFLAGGNIVTEDQFAVSFPFDGELRRVRATFAPGDGVLIGTRMLGAYRLTIDFSDGSVWLENA